MAPTATPKYMVEGMLAVYCSMPFVTKSSRGSGFGRFSSVLFTVPSIVVCIWNYLLARGYRKEDTRTESAKWREFLQEPVTTGRHADALLSSDGTARQPEYRVTFAYFARLGRAAWRRRRSGSCTAWRIGRGRRSSGRKGSPYERRKLLRGERSAQAGIGIDVEVCGQRKIT